MAVFCLNWQDVDIEAKVGIEGDPSAVGVARHPVPQPLPTKPSTLLAGPALETQRSCSPWSD